MRFCVQLPTERAEALERQAVSEIERAFAEMHGVEHCVATPGCTPALAVLAAAFGFEPGDEVITPSFTFVSTANAFVRLGARPVFVDIRPDTLNMDEELLEAAITPRTRLLMLNSPSNPTGASYTRSELQALGAVLEGHPDVVVVADDIAAVRDDILAVADDEQDGEQVGEPLQRVLDHRLDGRSAQNCGLRCHGPAVPAGRKHRIAQPVWP